MQNRIAVIVWISMVLVAVALAACVSKQEAPGVTGPATSSLFLSLSASPDHLPRDGTSVSTVKISARDIEAKPLSGQIVQLAATAGVITPTQVTTNSNGEATATFTAPGSNPAITSVKVTATPVVGDADEAFLSRTVFITLTTLTAPPVPNFTFNPVAPRQFDVVTFNASSTTYGGVSCGTSCSYSWNFGDGISALGLAVTTITHRYATVGNFQVTLVATAPGGASAETSKQVPVGVMTPPTAVITFSPSDPRAGEPIYFDGRGSTSPDNAQIVSYDWDFGDDVKATGAQVTHQYDLGTAPPPPHKYVVRLTVTDSVGRTGTTTKEVEVP